MPPAITETKQKNYGIFYPKSDLQKEQSDLPWALFLDATVSVYIIWI